MYTLACMQTETSMRAHGYQLMCGYTCADISRLPATVKVPSAARAPAPKWQGPCRFRSVPRSPALRGGAARPMAGCRRRGRRGRLGRGCSRGRQCPQVHERSSVITHHRASHIASSCGSGSDDNSTITSPLSPTSSPPPITHHYH